MKITPKFLITSSFNLLIFSVPLYFRFVNEELFEFNKMILVYALTTVIVFFWLVRMIMEKRLILKKTPLDFPLAAFVFSQFVSTIFSIHPHTSWFGYYSRFNGGFLSTITYVLLFYAFVSNFRKKDLGSFFLSTFISGTMVSFYGILEHFGHSFSCLMLPSGRSFGVDCWVQDVQSRVFASFGQPNWLAAYVITLLPLSFIASIQKKLPNYKRGLFVLTTISLFLVLLYTRSRSGLLGLVVGLGILSAGLIILFLRNKKSLSKKIHTPTVAGIVLTVLFITVFNGTSLTPSLWELVSKNENNQVETTLENSQPNLLVNRLEEGGTDSGEIRKIVWTGAYKIWQRYPLIGSGVETFAYSYYQDRLVEHNNVSEWDFLYNKAHNELLNILANTGAIGLITYLSIFVAITILTIIIFFSKKYGQTEKLIALALISGQASLFVSNFFGFSTVGVNVLMFVFFAITIIIYDNEKDETGVKKTTKESKFALNEGSQYLGLTLITIICLVLIFRVYNYWAADKAYAQGKNYFQAGQYQIGVQKLLESISRSPNEALYFDTLSDNYAKLAAHFANIGEATAAAQMTQETIAASNQVMKLNNRHLNFYKTRARVFVTLSQLDEAFLEEAKDTLNQAIKLSPTDPKLFYTLAVIEQTNGNYEEALKLFDIAVKLKPDYERPLLKISEIYQTLEKYEEAIKPLDYILENVSINNPEVLKRKRILQEMMDN